MRSKMDMSGRYCANCDSTDTYENPTTGRPIWHYDVEGLIICTKCQREKRRLANKYKSVKFKIPRNL